MKVFVTVGTTRFDKLVQTVLEDDDVLRALRSKGATSLLVQTGRSPFPPPRRRSLADPFFGLEVSHYAFKPSLEEDVASADLVVSHAGAGTCLEVQAARKPHIVVVNEQLADNHQLELAEKLSEGGHLKHCVCADLADTIRNFDASKLRPFPGGDLRAFSDFVDSLF